MDILLHGALSWNPERVLALAKSHRLFGLWSRTMAWEQGPYAFADGVITEVDIEGAIELMRRGGIDVVYSLFQVYDRKLRAATAAAGVDDMWEQLRRLLQARDEGAGSAAVVRHWGFDVHNLELDVVRRLDGQIFCNRHKLDYWTAPKKDGGCGLDLGLEDQAVAFFDGDQPSREFMHERFAPKLSAGDGEIHTVCVGRPLGIDFLRAAEHGIHVHVYGNNFNDLAAGIAQELLPGRLTKLPGAIADYLHVHPSIQPADSTIGSIRAAKDQWVDEFSRYDAGWSYVGRPLPWPPKEDAGAIPNRLGTYLLAGLPIIAEKLPGYYRYDTLAERSVAIDFSPKDYALLAADLRRRDVLERMNEQARRVRHEYSFEATVGPLVEFFERAIERRKGRQTGAAPQRPGGSQGLVQFVSRPLSIGGLAEHFVHSGLSKGAELVMQRIGAEAKSRLGRAGANDFVSWSLRTARASPAQAPLDECEEIPAGRPARVAVLERFPEASRNCDPERAGGKGGSEVHTLRLGGDKPLRGPDGKRAVVAESVRCAGLAWRGLGSLAAILRDAEMSSRDKRTLVASALATRGAPFAALAGAHEAVRVLRSEKFDRIECYSARGFALAPALSEMFGIPYREFLSSGTRYFGEFAFELLAVVPYAHWLHRNGRLRITQSCSDTKCLYYFSPLHRELCDRRTYIPVSEYPCIRTPGSRFDFYGFPEHLDTSAWSPPPYKSVFANQTFRWPKPLCILSNKYTAEPSTRSGGPVNFIPVPVLMDLLEELTPQYQVVYVRPRPSDIVGDHQRIGDFGDFAAIEARFPEVLTIQALQARHPELSFNELQMNLFANCEHFISVLGGSAVLASYFGGTNVVFAREGWEVSCNAYTNWFHLFSGAKIYQTGVADELTGLVRSRILESEPARR